jgi:hypothetical protein
MDRLEYTVLVEAYERAVELNLEDDFIQLLKEEIDVRRRNDRQKEREGLSKKEEGFLYSL